MNALGAAQGFLNKNTCFIISLLWSKEAAINPDRGLYLFTLLLTKPGESTEKTEITEQTESLMGLLFSVCSVISVFSVPPFSSCLEKLKLAHGRNIYAEANFGSFVAARAEMGAALQRVADRIAVYCDRGRGGD